MARIHWRIVAVSSDGRRSTMDEHTAARSPEAVRDWFGQASSACPPFPADRRVGSRAVVSLPGHSGKTVRQPAALAIFGDSLLIIARQIETRQQITVAPTSADRKSVVAGKSVSVRVDLGGPRIIKNINKHTTK